MSAFKQLAFIKGYKRRLQKKLNDVVEESENLCSVVQELTSKVESETKNILGQDDGEFFVKYSELQKQLESLSEKLFVSFNIITSNEECGKEKLEVDASLFAGCAGVPDGVTTLKSSKESLLQVSDVTPSTDSGICVYSHSNDSGRGEQKLPQNCDDPLSLTCSEGSTSHSPSNVANAEKILVCSNHKQSSTSITSQETISPITDHHLHDTTNPELISGSPKISNSEDDYLFQLNADSFNSFASENSFLHLSTNSDSSSNENFSFPPCDVLGTTVKAPITVFHDPSNFWLQLQNPLLNEALLKSHEFSRIGTANIKKTQYCVAQYKRTGCYQRAEIITVFGSGKDMRVQVNFIDSGFMDLVHGSEIRKLPNSLYKYPRQALHCFLFGIAPVEETWTKAAKVYFDEIKSCSDFRATILSKQDEMYAVQLTVILNTDFFDLAEMLCLQKLAIPVSFDVPSDSCSKPAWCSGNFETQMNNEGSFYFEEPMGPQYQIDDISLGAQGLGNCNVSSASKSSAGETVLNNLNHVDHADIYVSDESLATSDDCIEKKPDQDTDLSTPDLSQTWARWTESMEKNDKASFEEDLDVVVPAPCPCFLDDDLLIVIPSVIYSPSYFFCNAAMGNPLELDELREQMTTAYKSLESSANHCLRAEDIKEKMFLACPFDDGFWYRVQVTYIYEDEDDHDHLEIVVLFIDYGNEKAVDVKDLRPLQAKFAKYPTMGILCSLAYIKPISQNIVDSQSNDCGIVKWDKRATDRFSELTSSEKPITLQLSQYRTLAENRLLYEVFLWDTNDSGDRLINDVLVQEGFADYADINIIPKILKQHSMEKRDKVSNMDQWDPMLDHFENVTNSYGVDETDAEIATVGYKATDESYICKFFARDEYCYRGQNCPYKHVTTNYRDGTADQELVYAGGNEGLLPNEATYCLLQVSCVLTAGHFYVIFPYGLTPLDEIPNNRDASEIEESEFVQLNHAINEYYSKSLFQENTAVAPCCGNIVVAKTKFDGCWYRARIKEVEDVTKPVQVFFVDFGNTEWVERRNIRQILPQFLHCPFQAVEVFLANVDPVNNKGATTWTSKATSTFEELVKGNTLLAYINRKIGSVLFATLTLTTRNCNDTINNFLVRGGFARFSGQTSVFQSDFQSSPAVKKNSTTYEPA